MRALPEAGEIVAGYRIERPLGRGGMGVVYLAEQMRLARPVALKLIVPELAEDEGFRRRFERESQLAASLDHPNVIPVYEAGEGEGTLFISMRFVEGQDLRQMIRGEGRLDAARAAWLVAQMAAALDAAHERGLVHRDVKPANVMVTGPVGSEHAYLTDFGLTKHVSSSSGLTHTGQWVGTLDYVAPEQISGGALDARVDVYSLGCVLFEALTGRVPYPKDSDVAKMYAHLSEPPEPVSGLVPGLPVALDRVLERALAKQPEYRYPSAGDLGRAALAACEGKSTTVPERSVAAGAASLLAEPATSVPAAAPVPTEAVSRPTAALPRSAPPPPAWSPPPPAAAPASGVRWGLIAVCVTIVALAGIGAALFASGAFDRAPAKSTTVVRTSPRTSAPPASGGSATPPDDSGGGDTGTATTETFTGGDYEADYPADWTIVEDDGDHGSFSQTKFVSPDGAATVLIDRTPGATGDPLEQALGVEEQTAETAGYRRVSMEETTVGGRPATRWEFELPSDRRVDIFLNFGGDGYAVLGHGSDFETASRVADEVAASLR